MTEQEFNRVSDIKRLDFISNMLCKSLPANATVLDVGCGNGIISRNLGKIGFKVLGIDISENAIAKAKALNTLSNVDFKVVSAEQLEVSNTRYDAIVCSEVLEHLQQPEKLLALVHGSLKDDGVLIVTVPNGMGPRELLVTKPVQNMQKKNNFIWKIVKWIKQFFGYKGTTIQSSAEDLTHVQFFTKRTLENLANQTSFRIVRFGKTNFIEDVFPISWFTKRSRFLQRIDCAIAELLPYRLNGGFVTVWKKK